MEPSEERQAGGFFCLIRLDMRLKSFLNGNSFQACLKDIFNHVTGLCRICSASSKWVSGGSRAGRGGEYMLPPPPPETYLLVTSEIPHFHHIIIYVYMYIRANMRTTYNVTNRCVGASICVRRSARSTESPATSRPMLPKALGLRKTMRSCGRQQLGPLFALKCSKWEGPPRYSLPVITPGGHNYKKKEPQSIW